eukprot:scaffold1204_cov407-Prasinococcus_capsulatus_cf.AAC.12
MIAEPPACGDRRRTLPTVIIIFVRRHLRMGRTWYWTWRSNGAPLWTSGCASRPSSTSPCWCASTRP